ncbi:MAG: ATP-binding cassette domain-containing protein [Pseudomonadota bacterium]
MAAVEIQDLTKRFGAHAAVDGLHLAVPEGSIYGFLGANGAGKTTTLRLLLGLLRPNGGSLRIFGEPVRRRGPASVGALIEAPSLYAHLTGAENLGITRRLLGLRQSEIDRVLELVDLSFAANQRVGGYSLGMRQRLAIARALLGKPGLLILDEPTNGLDPEGIVDMRALLKRLPDSEGSTVLVSSHLLSEVEQIASHVGMIHRGKMLVEDQLGRLLGGEKSVEVETCDPIAGARLLRGAGFSVRADGSSLLVDGDPAPERIARLVVENGLALRQLAVRQPTLERVYHDQLAKAA